MMKASFAISTVFMCIAISSHSTYGWWFDDYHTPRPRDGSLRCYQCNSTEEMDLLQPLCPLEFWKHANVTEKRNMIMQCPRKSSAFCHLVISSVKTLRGCSGPTYENGRPAHIGCFSMGNDSRVCLCDDSLCNQASTLSPSYYIPFMMFFFHSKLHSVV